MWNRDEVQSTTLEVVSDFIGYTITLEDTLDDLSIDEVDLEEIVREVGEELRVDVDEEVTSGLQASTVRDIVALMCRLLDDINLLEG